MEEKDKTLRRAPVPGVASPRQVAMRKRPNSTLQFEGLSVDQAAAKRLVREYVNAIGQTGATRLSKAIETHTDSSLGRKTIELWLDDAERQMEPPNFLVLLKMFKTRHFQAVVPRTLDFIRSEARLVRVGSAFFDVYGTPNADENDLIRAHTCLSGLWIATDQKQHVAAYMSARPVGSGTFSRILLAEPGSITSSGLAFYDPVQTFFNFRLWSKRDFQEFTGRLIVEGLFDVPRAAARFEFSTVGPRIGASAAEGVVNHRVYFPPQELFESYSPPAEILNLFDELEKDVIPHGITEKKN